MSPAAPQKNGSEFEQSLGGAADDYDTSALRGREPGPEMRLEDRYALTRKLGMGQRDSALLHGPVRPWWSADSRSFWYATRDARGLGHVLVDVNAKQKSPLYDRDALATSLAGEIGASIDTASLALGDLSYDALTATTCFTFAQHRWRWNDATRGLDRIGEDFGPHEATSPDRSAAVSLDGPNLRLRDAGQSATRTLTTDGQPEHGYGDYGEGWAQVAAAVAGIPLKPRVLWSPDSRRFAVMRADQRHVPLSHLVQAAPPIGVRPMLHSYRYPIAVDDSAIGLELWFIGRDGVRVRAQIEGLESRCFNPLMLPRCRWSADGHFLDFLEVDRFARRLTLWRIDTSTGAAERKLVEDGPGHMFQGPSIVDPPMWFSLSDGRVLAWSQRSGWGHLYIHDGAGGREQVTEGPWLVRSVLAVDEATQEIVFTASGREPGVNPYYSFAYRVEFSGRNLVRLTPEDAYHEFAFGPLLPPAMGGDGAQSLSPDGAFLVDVWSTVTTPHRSVLRDAQSGEVLMDLETADPAGGWPDELPAREPFFVTALDAAAYPGCSELWGMLYKPAGFDPSRTYPVVEVVYGGPQTSVVGHAWSAPFYAMGFEEQLAALGFVVVVIDGPGTPYRSQAFQLAALGRLETCGGLPDHVNAIRHLAEVRPWMDLDRVGISGASGGGYATVRALGEFPEFFKVGVAHCGDHDNSAYIGSWGDIYEGPYDAQLYASQDNLSVIPNIRGDLFLVHGEMDDNVHPAMTLRIADALVRADLNFDLLIVPNTGHGVLVHPYARRRSFDYLVERLAGLKAPRPAAVHPPVKG